MNYQDFEPRKRTSTNPGFIIGFIGGFVMIFVSLARAIKSSGFLKIHRSLEGFFIPWKGFGKKDKSRSFGEANGI